MKKLINGIIDFQRSQPASHREKFAKLALGQSPDALFVTCSDSRAAPNSFASTDPGDLFVVRNVGNLIAPCGSHGLSSADLSEAAAIEFAVLNLSVTDIIICGHSECGAMQAILNGREKLDKPNLKAWLRHGEGAMRRLEGETKSRSPISRHNRLSQLNVLHQVENLMSYPIIRERVLNGELRLHGWWFELATATVHFYDAQTDSFVKIDESKSEQIVSGSSLPAGQSAADLKHTVPNLSVFCAGSGSGHHSPHSSTGGAPSPAEL